ncbi:hypothetical protein HNQ94_000661 [Salirhabdus euzebyi]|uniref:DUF2487 family protein n=1 Tax=Salirhabdus euzebyi TaxID=394506 RepID=A0A841PXL7_9BACI|nr:DUF2487 family protein [Salirhabdus euzebyi]MBB6452216.1 hypothetical protein [Salirhabdus euzebyi]
MKWNKKDMQKYVQAKEYVDTAIIPLVPFSFNKPDEEQIGLTFQNEVLELFVDRVERDFTGRVFQLPSYTYIMSNQLEHEVDRLNAFYQQINEQPFKHTFYLTFDSSWKRVEPKLEGNLIWTPVMKDGDLTSKETQKIVMDQIKQITELIRNYWI